MLEWNNIWHGSSLLFLLIEPTEQTNKFWTGTGTVHLYPFQIYLTFTMGPAGKKGKFSPCERMFVCQKKLAGDTYPNIRSKLMLRFGKQAPSRSSMQYMVEKLKTKHTANFCWQTNILSQGENSPFLPAGPMVNVKEIWNWYKCTVPVPV